MRDWPLELVCPHERTALELRGDGELVCGEGHRYRLVGASPVVLVEDAGTEGGARWPSPLDAEAPAGASAEDERIDPVVQDVIAATCGRMYRQLVHRLLAYPIPDLRLPPGEAKLFLEVGCNWGRWCVAAARRGYRVVGVDRSLAGVQAADRVARQLGVEARYAVADARRLPFPDGSFDVVFSYSVFQHFAKQDALTSFDEIGRVLRPGGVAKIQMANIFGVHSLWNQLREHRFREPRRPFDIRYWSPRELRGELSRRVGPTELQADGFFTLNAQVSDLELLPRRYRLVVRTSEALRRASGRVPLLRYSADSIYTISRRVPAD
jgi:SAM-dependent methyltransferase